MGKGGMKGMANAMKGMMGGGAPGQGPQIDQAKLKNLQGLGGPSGMGAPKLPGGLPGLGGGLPGLGGDKKK
jgi:signal recognition particle subunit SRP54